MSKMEHIRQVCEAEVLYQDVFSVPAGHEHLHVGGGIRGLHQSCVLQNELSLTFCPMKPIIQCQHDLPYFFPPCIFDEASQES